MHEIISTAATSLGFGGPGFGIGQLIMLVAAVIGLTVLMRSTLRRSRRTQQASAPSVRERYASLEKRNEAKRDLEHVMLELDQLARQVHGRLDTKFAKLETVIRDADERIDKLSRLVRAAKGRPGIDVTLEHENPFEPPAAPPREHDDPHAAIYRLAEGGGSAVEIAQEVGKTTGEVELVLALRKTREQARQATRI